MAATAGNPLTAESAPAEQTPSVLGYAILQLLVRNPASGYDLKKRFLGSVGHGWHAYDTQIYRELKTLEQHGYATGRVVDGRSGPQRRLFTITDRGRQSLVDWLLSPIDLAKIKNEVGLRVRTADLFPPGELEAYICRARDQWKAVLSYHEMSLRVLIQEHGEPDSTAPAEIFGRQLAIEHLITVTQANLAWADRALKVISNRAKVEGS
jgi:PadR family transcriptional regulator AphA